ncbi:MAG TPA: BBP7 family outer membrane beta-barrel protein [Pirellulales bacterium]
MPGYAPSPSAGYPQQGYSPQPYGGPQGYGMPMMQPAGWQQPGGSYTFENGQPSTLQAGPDGQMPEQAAIIQAPPDGQPTFAEQFNGEPGEAPVMIPQGRPAFTWNPPPTGSRVIEAIGAPYAALQDADGCNQGLFGDWAQIVRSRIGQVYVRAEAMMMRRGNPGGNQTLFVTNLQLPTQATAMTTHDLAFPNEVGQRMTVGLAFSERSAFEVTYLGLQNNVASSTVTGTAADLFLAGDLASTATAFSNANTVSAVDATMLQSLEFNYVATTIFERVSLIGGFRYFDVKDSLALDSNSATINGGPGNGSGSLTMNTLNQLYGGQGGFLVRQNLDLFTIELSSKAGVYENYATQAQFLDNNGTVLRNGFGSRHTSAFVGDIGLSGVYHFSNFVALRAGYNVIFIDNLALSPDQINLSGSSPNGAITSAGNGINHDGNLFLYGVNLGLDARF